ncbi:MAG: hypothetical protein ACLFO2_03785, partial [Candidatus Woesearchaeota archaeon]
MHERATRSVEDNPEAGLEQAVEEAYASAQRKPRPHKGVLLILTLAILIGGLMLVSEQGNLTGMITGPDGEEQALDTDITVDGTERLPLSELGLENITSLKVTGETEADTLEISLETPNGTLLVYSHEEKDDLITGNVAGTGTNVTEDGNKSAEEPAGPTDENKTENKTGRQENATTSTNTSNSTDNNRTGTQPETTNKTSNQSTNETTSQDHKTNITSDETNNNETIKNQSGNNTNTTHDETTNHTNNETANLTTTPHNDTDRSGNTTTTKNETTTSNRTATNETTINQSVNETNTSRRDEDNQTGTQPETTNKTSNQTDNTTTTKNSKTFTEACVETCTHQPITEGTLIITSEGETTITSITYTTTEEEKPLNQTAPIKDVTLEAKEETTIHLDEHFTGATYYDQPDTKG